MNEEIQDHEFDERLRWQLRALRTDVPPANDLWPGIAARLEAPRPRVAHRRAFAWLAAAAAVVMAFGIGWQLRPLAQAPAPIAASLVQREAESMTRDYDAAMRRLQAAAPAANNDPVLHELDRSAGLIRDALQRDPDADFLLQRLRHTYEKRLALTQRALLG
ncbi:hypothetical protein FNZ56_06650 [Pseudoluteimonas lycopersici]|uniref:Uncharacterized protein n=1 Tax=Pseudoluteimonas lycopersici TaxID=1324796 RepID=A0A516V4X0_9GAMM|nr:hypothetical protein [Lysobacter lycopersici]QDQ73573.1 hypothetical protein FNZ56_06650 [Lysobacter lycopersici]